MKKCFTSAGFAAILMLCAVSCQTQPKEHYYFVGYAGSDINDRNYVGGEKVYADTLPTVNQLRQLFTKNRNLSKCFIVSFYEFKNKEEADNFLSDSPAKQTIEIKEEPSIYRVVSAK